jgi:hypothetical protein
MASADTIMKTVKAEDSDDRLMSSSSLNGFSTNPNANLVPLAKNSTRNPDAKMTWP